MVDTLLIIFGVVGTILGAVYAFYTWAEQNPKRNYWLALVIFMIGAACMLLAFERGANARDKRTQAKWQWLEEHGCKRDHYVGNKYGATLVYVCKNGEPYTWEAIPVK